MNPARLSIALLILLAACDNMVRQPRYDVYGEGPLFADGKAMQTPPAGTIARDAPHWAAEAERPPMTLALLDRGRGRYAIYCSMCHALDGSGDGTVPARGFPRPADFRATSQRALSGADIYKAISDGYGVMYGFRDRVPPHDRWAIAAYVQALQRLGGS
ncbi:MAG TPA: cytochrome c [Sphingomonadaceae bacterium]|nr:cytochrome c [Sphingomonadaceae bacterium]